VRLVRQHPQLANRSCDNCRRFLYTVDGEVLRDRAGTPIEDPHEPDCGHCPKTCEEWPDDWLLDRIFEIQHIRELCKTYGWLPSEVRQEDALDIRLIHTLDQLDDERRRN